MSERMPDIQPNHATKQPFDYLNCPLNGSNLLEASAGTGKTFSLMFLYLRLLVEQQLTVDEILVATFTNAATAEIRERIYTQLKRLRRLLNQFDKHSSIDSALQALQEQYSDNSDDQSLLKLLAHWLSNKPAVDEVLSDLNKRLRLAQARFDYANIYSIDGFANHLLRENTDILGSYFPEVIVENDREFVERIYLTLASEQFTSLGEQALTVGQTIATQSYEQTLSQLNEMVTHFNALKNAEDEVMRGIADKHRLLTDILTMSHAEPIRLIRVAIEQKQLDGRTYSLSALEKFAAQLPDADNYYNSKDTKGQPAAFLRFFSQTQLIEKSKADAPSLTHPLFLAFDTIIAVRHALVSEKTQQHYQSMMLLAEEIVTRLPIEKAATLSMTFNDITEIVAHQAQQIKTPIKAALIDEAQDTNTAQLRLFEKLFISEKTGTERKICFFVGDPKQAIYGFRGANIFSYLAIQKVVEQHYILDTNYRSSAAVNDSINTLFSGHQPFAEQGISYFPIRSHKGNNDSDFGKQALELLHSENHSVEALADTAAARIRQLLNTQQQINEKPLLAKDIAVLVRSAEQGQTIKQALSRYGCAASFVNKKSSVYRSDEAKLFYWLLYAIMSEDQRVIRALMLSPLFAYTPEQTEDKMTVTELGRRLAQFANDYEKKAGFAVMFFRLMNHFHLAGRLLLADDGKRRLTNFIQLFECCQTVLQEKSLSLYGLCDWLLQRIHLSGEESELRLEDDDAVTIMTMHSAKGLEFPVVCLPFFDHSNRKKATKDAIIVSHQVGKATLNALNNPELIARVQHEEDAEYIRLAYVALTRAKYYNIIVIKADKTDPKTLYQRLSNTLDSKERIHNADFTHIAVAPDTSALIPQEISTYHYRPKLPKKNHRSQWLLDSFSRLQQHHQRLRQPTDKNIIPDETPLLQFPKGPKAGNALHAMYEHYMAHRLNDDAFIENIQQQTQRYLRQAPESAVATALAKNIAETADIPLGALGFCLNDIDRQQQSIEMKFFMHLTPQQRQYWHLDFGYHIQPDSEGFVHGYIDYCFAYQGRFYVLDYKSNYLGNRLADYHQSAMQTEMTDESYDLQAKIYTVALCKHLGINQQTDYEEKIGGFIYLFIRGMNRQAKTENNGIYHNRFDWQTIAPLLTEDNTYG